MPQPLLDERRNGREKKREQPAGRTLSYVEAVREATDQEMARDPSVILFGLDVDDPKAIQGTTRGLADKYGPERVFGTPLSEDAMTGAAVGMALAGLRPIHVHIRMDFLMLAMNQLVNVAAKSRYMYGGRASVPLVVRSMIGKSWGQGAQHSQGLHSLFMHVPGLKVVAPATPYDAKGCLIAAVRDDDPGALRRAPPFALPEGPCSRGALRRPAGQGPHHRRRRGRDPGRDLAHAAGMPAGAALSGRGGHQGGGDRSDLAQPAGHGHDRRIGRADGPAAGGGQRLALLRRRRRDRRPGGRAAPGRPRPAPAPHGLRADSPVRRRRRSKNSSIPTPAPSPPPPATWWKAPRPAGFPTNARNPKASNSGGRSDASDTRRPRDRPGLAADAEQHRPPRPRRRVRPAAGRRPDV